MVKLQKDAKKMATQRRSDRRDKESEIDCMLSDAAYISKVSALATAHSSSSGKTNSNQQAQDSPNDGSQSTILATASSSAASNSNTNVVVHVNVLSSTMASSSTDNDGFASCMSDLDATGTGGDDVRSNATTCNTTLSLTSPNGSGPAAQLQFEKDCDAFPWYREAMEELLDGGVDEEGFEAYLLKTNGTTDLGATDNPYVLSAAEWWAKEKEGRIAAINARLTKAKRLAKTGSAQHSGGGPSARTKEKQKVETFKLKTTNRFGGLRV